MSFTYEYARPALTSDCVIFGLDQDGLKILLIQRALPPFENQWALSGGFIHIGEDIDDCARRELQEETGLKNICLEQLATIGTPDRDPHEHVVTVAHFALLNSSSIPPPPPGSPSMTSRPSPSITAKSSSSPASASVEKSATNPSASNFSQKNSPSPNSSTSTNSSLSSPSINETSAKK
ncbi:MAG: NUDIX hydrolase [Akkermansiaceae bacterium]|nr:NUDIX hydrolase [Akkermansiaceae bacterium]